MPAGAAAVEEVGVVLAAFADPPRRQLLDVLVDAGGVSATTLARPLPVSRHAVVKHLDAVYSRGCSNRLLLEVVRLEPGRSSAVRRLSEPGILHYFGQLLPGELADPARAQ